MASTPGSGASTQPERGLTVAVETPGSSARAQLSPQTASHHTAASGAVGTPQQPPPQQQQQQQPQQRSRSPLATRTGMELHIVPPRSSATSIGQSQSRPFTTRTGRMGRASAASAASAATAATDGPARRRRSSARNSATPRPRYKRQVVASRNSLLFVPSNRLLKAAPHHRLRVLASPLTRMPAAHHTRTTHRTLERASAVRHGLSQLAVGLPMRGHFGASSSRSEGPAPQDGTGASDDDSAATAAAAAPRKGRCSGMWCSHVAPTVWLLGLSFLVMYGGFAPAKVRCLWLCGGLPR